MGQRGVTEKQKDWGACGSMLYEGSMKECMGGGPGAGTAQYSVTGCMTRRGVTSSAPSRLLGRSPSHEGFFQFPLKFVQLPTPLWDFLSAFPDQFSPYCLSPCDM